MKIFQKYWIKYLPLFLLLFGRLTGIAQGGGLVLDPEAYQSLEVSEPAREKGGMIKKNVDLRGYTFAPGNQLASKACVGWAIAHAYAIQKAVERNVKNRSHVDQHFRYSAAFIFNQIKIDCEKGARILDGIALLKDKGICQEASFPNSTPCEVKPSDAVAKEAQKNRLQTTYKRVFLNEKDNIENTKRQLSRNTPVIVGFSSSPDMRLRGDPFWTPKGDPKNLNGHAMVVVGYDDTGFLLMNSFGERWCDGGFAKIKFNDYEAYAKEGYVLDFSGTLKGTEQKKIDETIRLDLEGGVRFQHLAYDQDDKLQIRDLKVNFDSNLKIYRLNEEREQLRGEMIRMALSIPFGMNVYLVNVDGSSTLKELGAFEYLPDTVIYSPDEEVGFILDSKGREYIALLFSYHPIDQYDEKIQSLKKTASGNLLNRLGENFDLIDYNKIAYKKENPYFRSTISLKDGSVIPIILEISLD